MIENKFSPWPSYTGEEAETIASVLLSNKVNYWTGNEGRQFEKEFADYIGAKHAVAVANGTVALDLALRALNISKGDELIVTPRTYFASVSTIVNAGAIPVFADVDLNSQNITVESIKAVHTEKTRAIICVHLAGFPCEMDGIIDFAQNNNLKIIEDCAQAHGAKYKGRSVGTFGEVAAWSFCQDKIMTTGGEGGMVTTNSELLWDRMWSYKDHGKSWDAVYNRKHKPGFRWLHDRFGTNWRLTEMQSAIGRIQLRYLREWSEQRRNNAAAIDQVLKQFEIVRTVKVPNYVAHAEYRHYAFVKLELLKSDWSRDRMIAEISSRGVPCFHGSCPEVYLEKAFENTGWRPKERLSNAKQLGETSMMFLVHPTLTKENIERCCEVIGDVFAAASQCNRSLPPKKIK